MATPDLKTYANAIIQRRLEQFSPEEVLLTNEQPEASALKSLRNGWKRLTEQFIKEDSQKFSGDENKSKREAFRAECWEILRNLTHDLVKGNFCNDPYPTKSTKSEKDSSSKQTSQSTVDSKPMYETKIVKENGRDIMEINITDKELREAFTSVMCRNPVEEVVQDQSTTATTATTVTTTTK